MPRTPHIPVILQLPFTLSPLYMQFTPTCHSHHTHHAIHTMHVNHIPHALNTSDAMHTPMLLHCMRHLPPHNIDTLHTMHTAHIIHIHTPYIPLPLYMPFTPHMPFSPLVPFTFHDCPHVTCHSHCTCQAQPIMSLTF